MLLEKLGKKEYKFNIKIGETHICIPIQIVLLISIGLLSLGFLKAARQL
jgi:hypothetical protein